MYYGIAPGTASNINNYLNQPKPMVGAAIAGAATSLLGTAGNIVNTERTNIANKQLAEYQWRRSQEAWNQQNEYNSPTAQLERLKEAGLNTNLLYGGSPSSVSGKATEMPKYNAPKLDYRTNLQGIGNAVTQFMGLKMQKEQIKSVELDNQYKEQTLNWRTRGALETFRQAISKSKYKFSEAQMKEIDNIIKVQLWERNSEQMIQGEGMKYLSPQTEFSKLQDEARIKEIERDFMDKGGIRGTKDILPFIIQLLRIFGGKK